MTRITLGQTIVQSTIKVVGDYIAAARSDGGIFVCNLKSKENRSYESAVRFQEFAISRDGKFLAGSASDGTSILRLETGEIVGYLPNPGEPPPGIQYIGTPDFSSDSSLLAVGYHGRTRTWNWESGSIRDFKGPSGDFQHWPSWLDEETLLVHRGISVVTVLHRDLTEVTKLKHEQNPNVHAWCDPWLVTGGIVVWSSEDWSRVGQIPSGALWLVAGDNAVYGGTRRQVERLLPETMEVEIIHEGKARRRLGITWWDGNLWSVEPDGTEINLVCIEDTAQ